MKAFKGTVTKIYGKPKVSIEIIENAKSFNTHNQKCKKAADTNKWTNTDTLETYELFSKGLRRSMIEIKRVLISKEQNQI